MWKVDRVLIMSIHRELAHVELDAVPGQPCYICMLESDGSAERTLLVGIAECPRTAFIFRNALAERTPTHRYKVYVEIGNGILAEVPPAIFNRNELQTPVL